MPTLTPCSPDPLSFSQIQEGLGITKGTAGTLKNISEDSRVKAQGYNLTTPHTMGELRCLRTIPLGTYGFSSQHWEGDFGSFNISHTFDIGTSIANNNMGSNDVYWTVGFRNSDTCRGGSFSSGIWTVTVNGNSYSKNDIDQNTLFLIIKKDNTGNIKFVIYSHHAISGAKVVDYSTLSSHLYTSLKQPNGHKWVNPSFFDPSHLTQWTTGSFNIVCNYNGGRGGACYGDMHSYMYEIKYA